MQRECGKIWRTVTETDQSLGCYYAQVTWRRGDGIWGMSTGRLPMKKSMPDALNSSINERRMFFTVFFHVRTHTEISFLLMFSTDAVPS